MAKDLLEVTSEIIIGNHESFYREFRAAKKRR
ncbi:phage membrane protein [Streptococcus pyogenes]|nr:phage membrane protein [Streptococcus pyogenes]VHB66499.1 phage membrane protein [Streptococcus pyogenes]VHC55722.1 phage membrane protein [Streptococcus pyogenes]